MKDNVKKFKDEILNKFGLINTEGTILVPPMYDCIINVYKGHAWALRNMIWQIINVNNKVIFKLEKGSPNGFFNGISRVEIEGKYGYINLNGKWLCESKYEDVTHFHCNVGFVKKDGLWAMISDTAKILSRFELEQFKFLDEKRLFIKKADGWFEMNIKGDIIKRLKYDKIEWFDEGSWNTLKVKKNGKWSLVDINWKPVCSTKFLSLGDCHEANYASASNIKNKYGFINKYGETIVIPIEYDMLIDEWAQIYAEKNGLYFYIDHEGVFIPNFEPDKIENYGNSLINE